MKSIMLIGDDGKKISDNISFNEAKQIAKEKGLDLILVNKDKSIYKIGDQGKLNYERKQKEKKKRAQQREHKVKEIQIRPTTDSGDLAIKTKKIKDFLGHGLKTKLVMKFKRSQLGYKQVGLAKVNALVDQLIADGIATTDTPPKFEGNNISVFLTPPSK